MKFVSERQQCVNLAYSAAGKLQILGEPSIKNIFSEAITVWRSDKGLAKRQTMVFFEGAGNALLYQWHASSRAVSIHDRVEVRHHVRNLQSQISGSVELRDMR